MYFLARLFVPITPLLVKVLSSTCSTKTLLFLLIAIIASFIKLSFMTEVPSLLKATANLDRLSISVRISFLFEVFCVIHAYGNVVIWALESINWTNFFSSFSLSINGLVLGIQKIMQ